MCDWTYSERKAVSFSAFRNKNDNPTIGIRLDDGTSVHLSLNGGAAPIARQKLHGYGVKAEMFGRRLGADEAVSVTIRESVDEEGKMQRELASPAVADVDTLALLDL